MSFPLGRLTDAPTTTATVRYDFNDHDGTAPRHITRDFTLGVPTLLTTYDAVSQLYGPRNPAFGHTVKGSKGDALAAIATLSRELLRPSNWFLFQLDATTRPIWLQLYPSAPEALSLDNVYVDTDNGDPVLIPDLWEVRANFTAEPFAYGERITLGPYTVTQALTGDHPMRIDLPTIKGDAPASVRVSVTPQGEGYRPRAQWLLGSLSGAETGQLTAGASTFTPSGSVGAHVPDANYFSGGYRLVTIPAATPNVDYRFQCHINNPPQGRVRARLRCVVTSATDHSLLFQMTQRTASAEPLRTSPMVSVDIHAGETSRHFWVDLGELAIPFGATPPADGGSFPQPVTFAVAIGTSDGAAATVRVVTLQITPVEMLDGTRATTLTLTKQGAVGDGLGLECTGVFDGDLQTFWAYLDADVSVGYLETPFTTQGGFPVVDPAAEKNTLLVQALDNGWSSTGSGHITSKDDESTVTVAYHPRLLHFDGRP